MGRPNHLQQEHTRVIQEVANQVVCVLTVLNFLLKEINELKGKMTCQHEFLARNEDECRTPTRQKTNMKNVRKMTCQHEFLARNEDLCRTPTRQTTTERETRTRSPQMVGTPPTRGTTPPNAAPNTGEVLAGLLSQLHRDLTPASLSDQVPAGSPCSPVFLADLADHGLLTPKFIEAIERYQNGKK